MIKLKQSRDDGPLVIDNRFGKFIGSSLDKSKIRIYKKRFKGKGVVKKIY